MAHPIQAMQREDIEVFRFSAFDEPWKVGAEGTAGRVESGRNTP